MRALVYQGPSTFSHAADTRGLTVIIEIQGAFCGPTRRNFYMAFRSGNRRSNSRLTTL
ncbi:hypothetical protein SAMN05446935_3631 [Burkholderia sp. YR290]|jgi:hypothetical protein|nr:hypothetical protein SAMN05192544_1007220 [Paraburkholderia hospita]SKC97946.1 hypothetical protein SAMN05445504_7282 [Burkholderia sp. CF099]SKD03291.1 hypothetical protein SAMN05446934_9208 [Paraburkholderia hospita]SOE83231.1 hypothetical protein SAMN05446935_3631 [Burkholderia sp. YR290]